MFDFFGLLNEFISGKRRYATFGELRIVFKRVHGEFEIGWQAGSLPELRRTGSNSRWQR